MLYRVSAAGLLWLASASLALGQCPQTINAFTATPGVPLSVTVDFIDNRAQVVLNNQTLVNQRGNGGANINQNISNFLNKGVNVLVVNGYNEAYPGGHGGNPGRINYAIITNTTPPSDITRIQCTDGDNRGGERQFFSHRYDITLN